ncbi:MAG: TonB-dependent receptor [Bryobacteraceae bacterium]
MKRVLLALLFFTSGLTYGQSLGTAGTIRGKVTDPSGAVIADATVSLSNDLTLYRQEVKTSAAGEFQFANIPPNVYHLDINALGFEHHHRDLAIRSAVPVNLEVSLPLAAQRQAVTVSSEAALIEVSPSAHADADRAQFSKLATSSISTGLSDIITLATPAVVADSDGFFHSLGDHAQMALSVDNQPITDQQGSLFSTQIPANAIESIEAVYGGTPAEYGDKTSLVVTAVTRSGLGQKTNGGFSSGYGSFGTFEEAGDVGFGGAKWGQFFAVNGSRSGRFLDTPEYLPFHDVGNNMNVFSRSDYQPSNANMLHLDVLAARTWFQVPNQYDQVASGQDQKQMVRSFSIGPGWIHVFNPATTLASNVFVRRDLIDYYPSRDAFADQPATLSQIRSLTNLGIKTDLNYLHGRHNAKFGVQIQDTILTEKFTLGLTDPTFNPVCLDDNGDAVLNPSLVNPTQCAKAGFQANPDLSPGLVPYDLTRGGSLFRYYGHANIREQAFYGQDSINFGHLTLNLGFRWDRYDGIAKGTQPQPRAGLSYLIAPTKTVLRIGYSHSYETPLNENLVLSSATGAGFGSHFVFEGDYFWKYTRNAFDLDTLFTTAIFFPIEWAHSKMDGFSSKLLLRQYKGLSAYTQLGHTRARVFGPENGGLIFPDTELPKDYVVRIDHDQGLQSTSNVQYQPRKNGPWVSFTWRYDSGIVASAVPDLAAALGLTADQQAQIGFYCGSQVATIYTPITTCNVAYPNWGAKLVKIPAPGTENDDLNPARVRSRNLFNMAVGTDNLFHTERVRWTLRLEAFNITNKLAVYNFLSTCSGTHFVEPRSYRATLGIAF